MRVESPFSGESGIITWRTGSETTLEPARSSLSFAKDGKGVFFSDGGLLVEYQPDEKGIVRTFQTKTLMATNSQDGKLLACSTKTGSVEVWNRESVTRLFSTPKDYRIKIPAFLKDGTLALAADQEIEIWDCKTRKKLRSIKTPSAHTVAIYAFTPDRKQLTIPFLDFDLSGQECLIVSKSANHLVDLASGKSETYPASLTNTQIAHIRRASPALDKAVASDAAQGFRIDNVHKGITLTFFRNPQLPVGRPWHAGGRFLVASPLARWQGIGDGYVWDLTSLEQIRLPLIPHVVSGSHVRAIDRSAILEFPDVKDFGTRKKLATCEDAAEYQPEHWWPLHWTGDGRHVYGNS